MEHSKAVLKGKATAINAFIKREDLTLYLKEVEKEEQTKPKIIRRKDNKD